LKNGFIAFRIILSAGVLLGVLASVSFKTLPFIEVYKNLYLFPLFFWTQCIKSISLLNIYDGSSRMFTYVIRGQLARELLRHLTYTRFPIIPSFSVLIISLTLWELPYPFGFGYSTLLGFGNPYHWLRGWPSFKVTFSKLR